MSETGAYTPVEYDKARKFAEGIADYVQTHRRYDVMDKREAIISAVEVLCGDLGAAQSFMDTIGVKIDLYNYDFGRHIDHEKGTE